MACIFCGSDKDLTDEHVFPAFMGGRLEVRDASCGRCNRSFGRAEASIKKVTTPLLNLLRIRNRKNRVPNAPLRVNIHGLDMQSLRGFMDGNGRIRLQDYVRNTVTNEGRNVSQGFFISQGASEKFAARNKAKGCLIKRRVPKHIILEASYFQGVMFAFSVEARKVAAKIALTALAYKYGPDYALSQQFDDYGTCAMKKTPPRVRFESSQMMSFSSVGVVPRISTAWFVI